MQLELFDEFKPIKSNDWKWTMANDYPASNGIKVFSCFACGGGSTMGYKLAGCEVLGCVERQAFKELMDFLCLLSGKWWHWGRLAWQGDSCKVSDYHIVNDNQDFV